MKRIQIGKQKKINQSKTNEKNRMLLSVCVEIESNVFLFFSITSTLVLYDRSIHSFNDYDGHGCLVVIVVVVMLKFVGPKQTNQPDRQERERERESPISIISFVHFFFWFFFPTLFTHSFSPSHSFDNNRIM